MRLCVSCRFVSPPGSLLCGRCGRSFDGRLCPRHHVSPAGSRFCVRCGHKELTETTLWLPLGWLSRLLAWGTALLLISLAAHHAGGIVQGLWAVARWVLMGLLGIRPCALLRAVGAILSWGVALLILSWLLPGAAGGRLRGVLLGLLHWAGQTSFRLARWTGRWLYRRVEGAPAVPKKAEKKKKH